MYKTTQNFNIIVLNLIVRILQLSLFHSYGHQIFVVYETGHKLYGKVPSYYDPVQGCGKVL